MSQAENENENRPEFLLDKFNSVEDQAKSYAEAERRLVELQTQIDQERNQFASALQNMQELVPDQQQQTQQYNPQDDPLLLQYQQAVDNGDARSMLAIQLELNRQMNETSITNALEPFTKRLDQSANVDKDVALTMASERVSRSYDNWDELAPKVGRILQENPNWMPTNPSIEAYEQVLSMAAKVIVADEITSAAAAGQQVRQQKLDAQGLEGQGARVPSPEEMKAEWDKVKNAQLGGYAGILRG